MAIAEKMPKIISNGCDGLEAGMVCLCLLPSESWIGCNIPHDP